MDLIMDQAAHFYDSYQFWLRKADKRVADWPLMKSYWPTWALMFGYLIAVKVGQRLMASRQPFRLRWPLFAYNICLVVLNFHIFSELLYCSWKRNYNYLCQHIDYSDNPYEVRIAKALWWYYFSKCIEFMDTMFFVLRKKNTQISFLHLYHHATMFPIWWIGVKWVAGGQSFLGAMINSFIHVLMYTYYGLSSLGEAVQKFLWWKRYLTRLQLIQFFIGMLVGTHSLLTGCGAVPIWMEYSGMVYGLSMIALFANFYHKEYVTRSNLNKREAVGKRPNGQANGHAINGHVASSKKQH
uniref:Elongation of very long chain fatty acids protein n=1 Tax=Macrostomum lignano TaxID=282301 RepID=A0A1I8HNZ0_9PLAT